VRVRRVSLERVGIDQGRMVGSPFRDRRRSLQLLLCSGKMAEVRCRRDASGPRVGQLPARRPRACAPAPDRASSRVAAAIRSRGARRRIRGAGQRIPKMSRRPRGAGGAPLGASHVPQRASHSPHGANHATRGARRSRRKADDAPRGAGYPRRTPGSPTPGAGRSRKTSRRKTNSSAGRPPVCAS
jgi:hypothetical protein